MVTAPFVRLAVVAALSFVVGFLLARVGMPTALLLVLIVAYGLTITALLAAVQWVRGWLDALRGER
jgi:uncharacterized membrane protein AbrB (regulator of aidB expression)